MTEGAEVIPTSTEAAHDRVLVAEQSQGVRAAGYGFTAVILDALLAGTATCGPGSC